MTKKHSPAKQLPRFTTQQTTDSLNRQAFLIEFTPETLRMLRLHRGYTQARLAKLAGISSDYLSEIERGLSQPTIELIGRLGTALQAVFFK